MALSVPTLEDRIESPGLDGRRVLLRVDFNVPLDEDGAITDDTRIRAALPTLRDVLAAGGKPVCLMHLGRPGGEVVEELRVDAVGKRLGELLDVPVTKLDDSVGSEVASAIEAAPAGGVVLLENVRFHAGETEGDRDLARAYAALGDVFVNDAFGASHRAHASVSGIAAFLPSCAGRLLQAELEAFARVVEDPERPFVAILGGAKVSDKLSVIDHLLDRVDALLVGGGMAYTFLAVQGYSIGDSMFEEDRLDTCRAALAKASDRGVDLLLPTDHVVAARLAEDAEAELSDIDVPDGRMALDIGPATRARYAERIAGARTVVWNGPMGVFEMARFRTGTESVGRAVADCPGTTVVGGGDSVAAVQLLGLADRISHVSTGGGASLELLEGKELPGIACLRGS